MHHDAAPRLKNCSFNAAVSQRSGCITFSSGQILRRIKRARRGLPAVPVAFTDDPAGSITLPAPI